MLVCKTEDKRFIVYKINPLLLGSLFFVFLFLRELKTWRFQMACSKSGPGVGLSRSFQCKMKSAPIALSYAPYLRSVAERTSGSHHTFSHNDSINKLEISFLNWILRAPGISQKYPGATWSQRISPPGSSWAGNLLEDLSGRVSALNKRSVPVKASMNVLWARMQSSWSLL